jgi:hypothetical protein
MLEDGSLSPVYAIDSPRGYYSAGKVVKENGLDTTIFEDNVTEPVTQEMIDSTNGVVAESLGKDGKPSWDYTNFTPVATENLQLEIFAEDMDNLDQLLNSEPIVEKSSKKIHITKIGSGAQLGADMGGLDGAIEAGVAIGGTAAAGYVQSPASKERVPNFELKTKYGLKEGLTTKMMGKFGEYEDVYQQRTIANAQEFDGTLWMGRTTSPGAILTLSTGKNKEAQKGKPKPLINPKNAQEVIDWIVANDIHTINVAGNREFSNPGIYEKTKQLIKEVLAYNDKETDVDVYPFLADAEQTGVVFSTESPEMQVAVEAAGITDWAVDKVSAKVKKELQDKYAHCK